MASTKCDVKYWIFWGTAAATLLTWVFAVAAAADDAWRTTWDLQLGEDCGAYAKWCELYEAGTAFQFLATIVVSVTLVLVIVAAFMEPPIVWRLGMAIGILLAVFAVFELIAFACLASLLEIDHSDPGPTFGVAVVAWLFGVAGAVVVLLLLNPATSNHPGPFRACCAHISASAPPQSTTSKSEPPPAYSETV